MYRDDGTHHLHVVLSIESDQYSHGYTECPVLLPQCLLWCIHDEIEDSESTVQQSRGADPHIHSGIPSLLSLCIHDPLFDQGEHDVVHASWETTDEHSDEVRDWGGLKSEGGSTEHAAKEEVMEVVLTGTLEETEVVDVDRYDHPPWPVTIVSLVSIQGVHHALEHVLEGTHCHDHVTYCM